MTYIELVNKVAAMKKLRKEAKQENKELKAFFAKHTAFLDNLNASILFYEETIKTVKQQARNEAKRMKAA